MDPAVEARTRLFLQHQEMFFGFLRALVRSRHDAEDLLQELGVRVIAHPEAPLDPAVFPGWCRGVARNLVLHHWRSQRRDRHLPDKMIAAIDLAYADADTECEMWALRRRALGECLDRLAGKARELVVLTYVNDLSSEQVAQRWNRNAASVRVTLSRVRQALLKCVKRRLEHAVPRPS
jgi:RNA polymerase sigma factor (sigma-70 family)